MNKQRLNIYKVLYRFGDASLWSKKRNKEIKVEEQESYELDAVVYFNQDLEDVEFEFNERGDITIDDLRKAISSVDSHPEKNKYSTITFEDVTDDYGEYVVCHIILGCRKENDEEFSQRMKKEQEEMNRLSEEKKQKKLEREKAKIEKAKAILAKAEKAEKENRDGQ